MTRPADNWCPACEEACHSHPTVCTVCGSALTPPPPTTRTATTAQSTRSEDQIARSFLSAAESLDLLTVRLQDVEGTLSSRLSDLRARLRLLDNTAQGALLQAMGNSMPLNLFDPQGSQSRSRGTSKHVLDTLPRIIMDETSSLCHQATIIMHAERSDAASKAVTADAKKKSITIEAIRGELGCNQEGTLENCQLVLAEPSLTGKLPLNVETKARLAQHSGNSILYMDRGDITFAQKARMAQNAGAGALVVGNSLPKWPYVMQDTKKEATDVTIPVVMMKQDDGQQVKEMCRQQQTAHQVRMSLKLQRLSRECVVCQDELANAQKVLKIPNCDHMFHEQCALQWLTKHNTCPYCRFELPTDDPDYENERRRQQRTHAGSDPMDVGVEANHATFYG